MPVLSRQNLLPAIQRILDRGCWCVYEVCLDIPGQRWEPRVLICHPHADQVIEAIEAECESEPALDARVNGFDRVTLHHDEGIDAQLCYLAD